MTKLASILVVFLLLALQVSAQTDWKGSYYFGEDGGKTAGGTGIFISHDLKIFDGDNELVATLESNGFQTSADLICTAKTAGTKLMIYFQSYGENNMFEKYQPGDLLLTLESKTVKGKPVILTYWGKFTPAIEKNEKPGKVYFEKVTPAKVEK
ncbi:MAG: hypothetical protein DMF63_07615 [Acidobacteria bacterium]|nr:MAG: hypothetical protein DMF63_07615 [Acidobacteriota bacterium]